MLTVGLTGGIACGKSQVLKEFQKLGVYAIDADKIAHRVIRPGRPAHQAIVAAFGSDYLADNGAVDRKKLGNLIFSDEQARKTLNAIVHPFVFEEQDRLISQFRGEDHPKSPIVMVDAALMCETGSYRKYDFLLVVYCQHEIQLSRLMARDGFSEDEAVLRIQSQMPLLDKLELSDYIIENSGTLSRVSEQVKQVFTELVIHFEELE